jgi:hypothetical protein
MHVMAAFHVPGGIITVEGCAARPEQSFTLLRGTTLNEALDALARQFGSRATMGPGFLDIWSDTGTPPLLDTRIRRLVWHRNTPDSVVGQLMDSPELIARGGELGLERGPGQGGAFAIRMGAQQEEAQEPPLRIENAMLLDALNSVALSKGSAVWVYVERVCGSSRTWTLEFPVH